MKGKALLLVGAMALALVLAGGVALAADFICDGTGDNNPDPGICEGTNNSDVITGTSNGEFIFALDGDDIVNALNGEDTIDAGDGEDDVDGFSGNDAIFGGTGGDKLAGAEDSDQVFGEGGPDFIDLAENDTAGSEDRGFGGPGNDTIDAFDGNKDEVNCGKGTRDKVFFDKGLDTITRNCEIKRPNRSP